MVVGSIKKLRPLYEVELLETNQILQLKLYSWTSPQKSYSELYIFKSATKNYSHDDFLVLQQSLCNIHFSFGLFISIGQRENLVACTIKKYKFGAI